MGGYKEIIAEIRGRGAFAKLKFESGVHRVQRVPDTEASGRIHTSAATVAVLPEAEEVDVAINDADLKIDTMRARRRRRPARQQDRIGGPRHAYSERHRRSWCRRSARSTSNRAKAMALLRAKLYDAERSKHRRRARRRSARPGRLRRPLRAHPHLQLPAGPRHRSPHQSDALQAAADHRGRSARRGHRRAGDRASGGAAGGGRRRAAHDARPCSRPACRSPRHGARSREASRRRARYARARCARCWSAMRSASTIPAWRAHAERALDAGEADADRRRWRRGGSPASRSRASSARRNSGAWRCASRRRRWCRGRRPRPWWRRRSPRSDANGPRTRPLRIADLGTGSGALLLALLSELPNAFGVGTDRQPGGARDRARQCRAARAVRRAPRSWSATSARRSPAASISWCRIRPISRPTTSRRWRPRCAITSRGSRSTAAPTGSTAYRAIAPMPCACWRRRGPGGGARQRPGRQRWRALLAAAGLNADARADRSCGYPARAVARPRHDRAHCAMTE